MKGKQPRVAYQRRSRPLREGHPARALAATAPLDFDDDDEVDEGALPVADPVLELDDSKSVELEELGGEPSADDALAVAWNASKDLFAVGLTAKTIPCSQ